MFLLFVLFVIYIYIYSFFFLLFFQFSDFSFIHFYFLYSVLTFFTLRLVRTFCFSHCVQMEYRAEPCRTNTRRHVYACTRSRESARRNPRARAYVHVLSVLFFSTRLYIAYYWVHIGLSVGGRNFSWRIHMRPNQLYARRRSKQGKNGVSRHATDH